MTFTKSPPTKPGAYWFHRWNGSKNRVSTLPVLIEVWKDMAGNLGVQSWASLATGEGEWCGPLVPVEEVERAWCECLKLQPAYYNDWLNSRARKTVEGETL